MGALLEGPVGGVGQSLQDEGREALAGVEPVEADDELFVIHALAGQGNDRGPGLGVLAQVSLPAPAIEDEDALRRPQGVEQGPVEKILRRVVGTVVASPAGDTLEVAALVEVAGEELLTGGRGGLEERPLQQSPVGRRNRRGNGEDRLRRRLAHRRPPPDHYGRGAQPGLQDSAAGPAGEAPDGLVPG